MKIILSVIIAGSEHFESGCLIYKKGSTTELVCGNCGEVSAKIKELCGKMVLVITKFRITMDFPIKTLRICQRGVNRQNPHRHNYSYKFISGTLNSSSEFTRMAAKYREQKQP